jgi:predicted DNA-binding transcriptional regulator AlpA
MSQQKKKTLTPKEVEAEYGYSERTLESWRHRGQGPAWLKPGKSVRYDRADIEAWHAKIKVTPTGSPTTDLDDDTPQDTEDPQDPTPATD